MATAFVDRLEAGWAVLIVNDTAVRLPTALLPPGTREGDYVEVTIELARDGEARKKAVADARRAASRDDDGGDFSL